MSRHQDFKMISVIVPVYRGEKTIERDIFQISLALSKLDIPYEVIVVIDGMVDQTFKKALKAAKGKRNITIVGYTHNRGKGYAVRYGMARSKGDIIAFIDAGSDIVAEGLSMLLAHYRWYNADIIVGSKRHEVSKVNYPFVRKVLSRGYQILIKILFGLSVRDTQVGMKLYRRSVLEDVLPRLLVKRFAFDIEILAVSHYLGYTRIYEAPIELDFTGVSTITSAAVWKILFNMLWDTMAIYYRLNILHYYDTSNKRTWVFDPELNFRINLP
jgi:glycosyltransferase involved in cell wall biosynthesis